MGSFYNDIARYFQQNPEDLKNLHYFLVPFTNYIFVDSAGNDTTGNGTFEKPYLTLSKAHTVATTGQTIILGNGDFAGATITKSINITSIVPNTRITSQLYFNAASNCYIDNLSIVHNSGLGDQACKVVGSTNINFRNCKLIGSAVASSIILQVDASTVNLENCYNLAASTSKPIDVKNTGTISTYNCFFQYIALAAASIFNHANTYFIRATSTLTGTENKKIDPLVYTSVDFTSIPAYLDDTAAGVGGLTTGQIYQVTATGVMMVKQ